MISIACSGFPVPVSRYFQAFKAIEISDTELGIPGIGTRKRWLREAPPGFVFTVLAPKLIAAAGFVLEPAIEQAIDEVARFAKQLKSRAVVFAASEQFTASRKTKPVLRAFAEHIAKHVSGPVLDLPGWSRKEIASAIGDAEVNVAFDPLAERADASSKLSYMRLAGPSGYRSRYDAGALDRVVERCEASTAKQTFVAFRNIDRFENARYVMNKLGIEP
jgi:uncharacterized protein YecE (DUF72 family)